MLGAIIGDYVGSVYEFDNIKTKDFPLFREDCFFTDDTVMTVATAEAIMNGGSEEAFIASYKNWGITYPFAGYGDQFQRWLRTSTCKPYNSWGNGAAMRVSPCGEYLNYRYYKKNGVWKKWEWDVVTNSAKVTHNHPEGIKGAQVVSAIIACCHFYLKGKGASRQTTLEFVKAEVRALAEGMFGYDLSMTLDQIRSNYRFTESCQDTVPQAITAFLESVGFEDAIRNAISLGGDSDTLAAITGSIAEAAYGIPYDIKNEILEHLNGPFFKAYKKWNRYINNPIFRAKRFLRTSAKM